MYRTALLLAGVSLLAMAQAAQAEVFVQCPGDTNGDGVIDAPDPDHPHAKCMSLTAGDGFVTMANGEKAYSFGFNDVTGVPEANVVTTGLLAANFPAPAIEVDEGDELYLTLTNVGLIVRPDLFDPHTLHFHGHPNAATVFDGEPEAGISVAPSSSFTYYYHFAEAGTYMYHCHVEAAEHMQMGMLGHAYVRPKQDKKPNNTNLNGYIHHTGDHYAYNDGDGATRYDKFYAVQLGSFDREFHAADEGVQPPPFAYMNTDFPMLNGRGYPDTVINAVLSTTDDNGGVHASQKQSALITANRGQRVLLRLSSLDVTRYHTLVSDLPMTVVGRGARLFRGWGKGTGKDLAYVTNSVTLGGGESADVILDLTGVARGTYFLRSANLQMLSNAEEDLGGMMTEVVVQ